MHTAAIAQSDIETTSLRFEDLALSPPLLEVLNAQGFEHPTRIQAEVLPIALGGRDVVGLAQTGSGKTAAFCLPMAERLYHGRGVRGLILCPTREIALQTEAFLQLFGEDHQLRTACLIGGVKYGPQFQALKAGPDIIVATPGRLLDHEERGTVDLGGVEMLVMDEADHMLDLGFLPQIRRVLERLPRERQTMMFSATMPTQVERLAQQFMQDPAMVDLRPLTRVAEGIEHRLYLVEHGDKKKCLMALMEEDDSEATLVFVRRKVDADWICRQLEVRGHEVEKIHGDRTQQQRTNALSGMRKGKHRILVATDVAARGIDIPILEHIVNFDIPQTVEDYVHRAGRTARGAAGGTVSTIATWLDKEMIRQIEQAIDQELPRFRTDAVEPYEERKKTIKGRERVRRRLR